MDRLVGRVYCSWRGLFLPVAWCSGSEGDTKTEEIMDTVGDIQGEVPSPSKKFLVYDKIKRRFLFPVGYDISAYHMPLEGQEGWEALKIHFEQMMRPGPGSINMERDMIGRGVMAAAIIGFLWGCVTSTAPAYTEVKSLVVPSRFTSLAHGQQVITSKMLQRTNKSGWKKMWRVSLLTFMYLSGLQTLAIYSGKYTWWSFPVAGGVACSLYRFHLGARGMAGGLIVGGTLGLLHTCIALPYFYVSGNNLAQFREMYKEKKVAKMKRNAKIYEKERKDYLLSADS